MYRCGAIQSLSQILSDTGSCTCTEYLANAQFRRTEAGIEQATLVLEHLDASYSGEHYVLTSLFSLPPGVMCSPLMIALYELMISMAIGARAEPLSKAKLVHLGDQRFSLQMGFWEADAQAARCIVKDLQFSMQVLLVAFSISEPNVTASLTRRGAKQKSRPLGELKLFQDYRLVEYHAELEGGSDGLSGRMPGTHFPHAEPTPKLEETVLPVLEAAMPALGAILPILDAVLPVSDTVLPVLELAPPIPEIIDSSSCLFIYAQIYSRGHAAPLARVETVLYILAVVCVVI